MSFDAKLPEVIQVEYISRIGDLKSIWRQGIKELEATFQEHLSRMTDQFDSKAQEYERLRQQLIANHEYLKRFNAEMVR